MTLDVAIQVLVNGFQLTLIYMLMALGLTLIFGIMDVINFAHGALYMLGAFSVFYLYGQFHLNFFLALVLTMVMMAILGMLLEKAAFFRLRHDALLGFIVALGLATIIQGTAQLAFGITVRTVTPPYRHVFELLGARISLERLLPALVGLVLAIGLLLFIRLARQGKMMRAVAQDAEAATLQGISIPWTRMLAFGLGCGLAAAAGALMAPLIQISPYMGMTPLLKAFIIIVLGGLGSIGGALLGAIVVGAIDGMASTFIGSPTATLIGFALFLAILVLRPKGLIGRA